MFFKRAIPWNLRGKIPPWSTPKLLAYYNNEPISKHLLKSYSANENEAIMVSRLLGALGRVFLVFAKS
jgi:hypothetical protein